MKKRNILFSMAALWLFSGVVASQAEARATKEDVVKFVEEGLAYAKAHGNEAFFKEIMNDKGAFKRGELYFYAYDFKGVVLAHGAKPHLVGKNLYNLPDKNGKKLIQELIKAVNDGTGWVDFYWQNPTTKKVEHKLGYAIKLDDTCWFGSGIYAAD